MERERFLELVQTGKLPICRQCRRYVRPASLRTSTLASEHTPPTTGLARKARKNAKRTIEVESMPFARTGIQS